MKKKRFVVFSLIFIFSALAVLYISRIYSYLAFSSPVQSDVLIVEGWLSKEDLDKACSEFYASGYRYIITTGFQYYKGFMLGSMGELRFKMNGQTVSADTMSVITVSAKGTKAYSEFPHFKLFADSLWIGESFVNARKKVYAFPCRLNHCPSSVIIKFDNDTYSAFRDRNLIVYSITVNGKKYDVNDPRVAYFSWPANMDVPASVLNITTAHETAVELHKRGIPDSAIFPVGSFRKIKSKTYTSGLDVSAWMSDHRGYSIKSINIFTSGCHARRSYLSYRKAIHDKSIAIGVISCYNPKVNSKNFWKTRMGIKQIVYETVGCLYILLIR
jgi:hypothetical protein